jgi:hypothetical protein
MQAASSSAPTAPKAPAAPPYRAVHIDTLSPDRVAQFESGRRAWVAELRKVGASDGRGVFLRVGDHRYLNMRPFSAYASFDTRVDGINAALARVPKEAGEAYDRDSDQALVFPHTSEIWRVDDDLTYVPAQGALTEYTAAVGRIVLDDVRPDPVSGDRYWNARGEIDKALAAAGYPLTLRTFRCSFGAGHLVTLVLAPSQAVLDAAPTQEAAVARVLGAAKAAELFAAVDASIVKRETELLVVRHDLTWPDAPPAAP